MPMRVIGVRLIEDFKRKHPASRGALDRFLRLARENDFGSVVELRRVFPRANIVGTRTVFDVGGNKVRCITLIEYGIRQMVITDVLTHNEYDKGKWKD
jgi:mRNA interferase HigB